MRDTIKKLMFGVIFLCISIVMFPHENVNAAQSKTNIRVAFYPLEGFFEYDKQGKESGYGVELLEKISQYTGVKFTYVKASSWENTKKMLLEDKADLRMPATKPTTPSTTLQYNNTSLLSTYEAIMCLKSRDDLYYQDYNQFKKIKIAISIGSYTANSVQTYFDSVGIKKSQIVFCKDYNECYRLLKEKKVDALISNIMDMNYKMKMLSRFNNEYNYFSMVKGDSRLNLLENAMTDIASDEPSYLANLYTKWFPNRITVPYTKKERNYLKSVDTLTFAFQSDEGYLSRLKNGKYYGIYVELAKAICQNLGVKFKAVSREGALAGKVKADVYSGFFYDQNYADEYKFSMSAPINDINYYIIKKKENSFDSKTCRIAAIKKYRYTKEYIEKQYPKATIIYCDSYEKCLQAVESKKADMTIINNYIAEYFLGKYQFNDLSVNLSDEYSHLYCFAAANKNSVLASLLTKGIQGISEEEKTQIYIKGQEEKPESNYLEVMIYQNPVQVVLVLGFVLCMILAVVFLVLYNKKSKKQNAILEEALSAKSDFLARMSHDMRTPMNGILGITHLLQSEKMSDDVKNGVNQIQLSGEYLLDLINDTLDMNKIELKRLKLHKAVTDVKEITNNVISNAKMLAKKKNIDFVVDMIHPEKITPTYLYMDRARTEQIFMNLISNAVKYTKEGGTVHATIERIETKEDEIVSRYIIQDNGIGMSPEFLQHMYEPFAQEGKVHIQGEEGTGLGLAIVKQLVELMHGEIHVESEENKGTTFTLILPFEKYNGVPKSKEETTLDESKLYGKRVLLCEDHPLNAQITEKLLQKKQIEVDVAQDGAKGLEKFETSSPGYYHMILMDLRMPVMDGYEATKKIRSLDRDDAKNIPIIAMTANAFDDDVEKCLAAGMNEHLSKPIDLGAFYHILMEYL